MSIEKACASTCPAVSATRTVNDDVPDAVGVPEIAPVAGFTLRFCGSVPKLMLHVSAPVPPVAWTV
jgi:hypothetical protein